MAMFYIKNRLGDYYLHEVNGGSFNQRGAYATYQSLYGVELFKANHLYVMVGTDGGVLPAYIVQCGVPQGSRYLFVELEHLWQTVSTHPELSLEGYDPSITIVSEKNWYSKLLAWGGHRFLESSALSCFLSLSVQDPQDKQYTRLASRVFYPMEKLKRDFMEKQKGAQGLIHQITNIADNRLPVNLLHGQCTGWPAIYLGAEKSLEIQLPQLKSHLHHCFIVADIKILSYLLSEDVYPHMVVAMDPCEDPIPPRLYNSMEVWPILLIPSGGASDIVGNWLGPHVYLDARFPWGSSMNIPNLSSIGESTATVSIKLLLMLGCDPVFLLGVDLCHGDPFAPSVLARENTTPYLYGESLGVTYGGEQRICDPSQVEIQNALASLLSGSNRGTVYNLSKEAINVSGIAYGDAMLLESIIATQTVATPHYHLNRWLCQGPYEEELQCCASTVRQYLEKLRALESITLETLEQTSLRYVSEKVEKEALMGSFKRTLRKHYKEEMALVNTLMSHSLLSFEIESKPDKAYVTIIAEGISHLKNALQDTLSRIKARLEEQKLHPHWYFLMKQWQQDGQEGRAILWRRENLQAYAQTAGTNVQRLEQLENGFISRLTTLNKKGKEHRSPFTLHRLIALKHTVLRWAMNKNRCLLKQYVSYLEKVDSSDAQLLKIFCEGLLAELDRDDKRAIDYYLKAAEGIFTEVALQQLTSLLIKRNDQGLARRCLLCLGAVSPGYLPQYAYYCSLIGDVHEATSAYDDYLEEVPEDAQAKEIRQAMLK